MLTLDVFLAIISFQSYSSYQHKLGALTTRGHATSITPEMVRRLILRLRVCSMTMLAAAVVCYRWERGVTGFLGRTIRSVYASALILRNDIRRAIAVFDLRDLLWLSACLLFAGGLRIPI